MRSIARRTLAACLLIWLTFGLVACAAVEEGVVTKVVESDALKAVLNKLSPFFERVIVGKTEEVIERRWVASLASEQRVVFQSIERSRPRVRWRVTSGDVKAFVHAFEAGMREPEQHFTDPLADPKLVQRWLATPKQNRVFVAGAQEDTAVIEGLRARLEQEKKIVFFYQFCSGTPGVLCASSTVGAFFKTAGTAVWAVSENAEKSPYLRLEVETARRFATHQNLLYIVTPDSVRPTAAAGPPLAIHQSLLYIFTPDDTLKNPTAVRMMVETPVDSQ
jgi:hypothetical protein